MIGVSEAIRRRRSIRRFRPDPVSPEIIKRILEAGTMGPTGGNMQPWEFIIVDDPDVRKAVVEATFSGYYSGPGNPQSWILTAPLLIVVCCDFKRTYARYGNDGLKWAPMDVAASIENMILAAVGEGLGSCWVGGFREAEVIKALGLPKWVKPLGLLPIGYPDENPSPRPRLPISYITHRNRFNQFYFDKDNNK